MTSRTLLTLLALAVAPLAAPAKEQVETVFLFQNRQVVIAVPDGLGFASGKDSRGMMTVQVADQKQKVSLQVTFLPDPESQFSTARSRREFMNETFGHYVESSVEKSMQFEELEPRIGAGTYCVFTDASLVGKAKVPAGEYLHSTTGLKAWSGVVAVFSFFSADVNSPDYLAVMKMLRESVHENPLARPRTTVSTGG